MLEDLSEIEVEAASQAKAVGKKILDELNQPYRLLGNEYRNTPSIGVTLFFGQHHSPDDLLKQADIAMYQAKKSGRNSLRFFDPRMQEAIGVRVSMEKELRAAVDSCAFQLHYQLQADQAGNCVGAEALLRWKHPSRGMIPPADFIPVAEETGLILPLGAWVIETACAQLKTWREHSRLKELVLAVNVSAEQMRDDDFVHQVKKFVAKYTINPRLLKLELTESMLVDNASETIEKIKSLRNIGVQFSLDDFGTGYSSLQYLKRIPLDQLKIDQSFVRGLEVDQHDLSIVRTVIAIAHSMELEVIAEGVETEGQLQILKAEGCNFYQGYLLGRPMAIEQFEGLF
jgi:EAL domain-containing protein (putative c-di-GMP-specific phosphodiesterase class I)